MPKNFSEVTPYIRSLADRCMTDGKIDAELYTKFEVNRGLRDIKGRGVLTGLTEVSEVNSFVEVDGERIPCEGQLFYRGVNIKDIVQGASDNGHNGFEETVFLLMFGHLPTMDELEEFSSVLGGYRSLPTSFVRDVILKAPSKDMMNVLARSVLTLYTYDDFADDISPANVLRQCLQLISMFPLIAVYGYQAFVHYHDNQSLFIHPAKPELSTAENLLHILRQDSRYTKLEAATLDMALILHAEHGGGNNSTFTNHVVTSSGTDTYSAMAASLGSLKGPRHGGANITVQQMLDYIKSEITDPNDDGQIRDVLVKIVKKQGFNGTGLVYGMGHAVYTLSDPRAVLLKKHAYALAESHGFMDDYRILDAVERLTPEVFKEVKGYDKPICANVDLYSGLVYRMLGIPAELLTPMFATARIAGWSAHRCEELYTCNKIIRPAYKFASGNKEYVPIYKR